LQSNKKKIVQGVASDSVIFVLTTLISFSVIPFYLHFISLEEFGIYVAIQGIVAVVSLADIGLPMHSTKKLSKDIFFESKELNPYLHSAQIFQYILGLALLFLGYLVYSSVDSFLDVNLAYANITQEVFLLYWFSVIVGVWFGLNHAILRSRHELKYINISIFMILILSSGLNIIFLYLDYGLISFGISILITTIVVNAFIAIKVYKNYKINLLIPKEFHTQYIAHGLHYIMQFQFIRIAQVSKTSLFTVLLSNYGGQSLVAQYNITNKAPALIPGFISKVIMNLFPSISAHFENGEREKIIPYFEKIFKLGVFTIIFFLYALFSLNEIFIDLWVGQDNFIGIEIFIFILLNFVIMTFISFTGIIIQGSGEFKKMPLISVIEFCVFLISSYMLFKIFGIIGFFLGYILSSMLGLVYPLFLVNRILNVNLIKFIVEGIKRFLVLLISMFFVDITANLTIDNNLIKFLVISLLYLVLYLLLIGGYSKINVLKFLVEFYKAALRRINKK
jgi:O-antigen/teichoic acid export membrane protein